MSGGLHVIVPLEDSSQKGLKALWGNQPKMIFSSSDIECILKRPIMFQDHDDKILYQVPFWKDFFLFVRLKSIVSLQLRATMTGLIKEVINRSPGHPQGGGSEMGGRGAEKKTKNVRTFSMKMIL